MKKNIFHFFILLMIISFSIENIFAQSSDSKQGKHFRLKNKFDIKDSSFVKVNGYYREISGIDSLDPKSRNYKYYRFLNNGRVFIDYGKGSSPSIGALDSFKYVWGGYYIIENKTIKIETYDSPWTGYLYDYGIIHGDTLCIYATQKRGFRVPKEKMNAKYIFVPCCR